MDKDKNKGLADNGEGEFILNESGTSVSIDPEINFSEDEELNNPEIETGESEDVVIDTTKDEQPESQKHFLVQAVNPKTANS